MSVLHTAYADENPLDGTDPSGLRIATDPGLAGEEEAQAVEAAAKAAEEAQAQATKAMTEPLTQSQQVAATGLGQTLAQVVVASNTLNKAEAQLSSANARCQADPSSPTACNGPKGVGASDVLISNDRAFLGNALANYESSAEALVKALVPRPKSHSSVLKDIAIGTGLVFGAVAVVASGGAAAVPEETLLDWGLTTDVLTDVSATAGFISSVSDLPDCAALSAKSCFAMAVNLATAGLGAWFVNAGVSAIALRQVSAATLAAFSLDLSSIGDK